MYEFTFYTLSSPIYFEPISRFQIGPEYQNMLRELLPASWKIIHSDVWLQGQAEGMTTVEQGFKIHLSSTLENARATLESMVPICVRHNTIFKIVSDPALHRFLNAKRYSRAGSGKFATIYPPDAEAFASLAEELHRATRGLEGPYILSDKRYKDSKTVFYRYGAFKQIKALNVDGTQRFMLHGPDGTLVEDRRTPYFELPEWVTDIGPAEVTPDPADTLLHRRYEILEALSFTNTGGVYRALDITTQKEVVIKEARPHTLLWAGQDTTFGAIEALQHECLCLQKLEGLPFIPKAIEIFQDWEHWFLAVSFVEGIPIARLRAKADYMIITKVGDPEQTQRFCTHFRDICLRLLDALEATHARGVVLGDISPGNVLVNTDTGEITFIDLESAQLDSDTAEMNEFSHRWFNPGFRAVSRIKEVKLREVDDIYACGMLLYNLLCPVHALFDLDPAHPRLRFLEYFTRTGVPREVHGIIYSLLHGRAEEARSMAEAWDTSSYGAAVLR